MIPKCDQATMYAETDTTDDDEGDWEYTHLCVHEDGAMSSSDAREYPKFRRFDPASHTFQDMTEYGDMSADETIEEMLKHNDKLSFPVTTGSGNKLVPDLYEENKVGSTRRRKLMGSSKNYNTQAYVNPAEPYIECVDDNGHNYDHDRGAFVTESGNGYEQETRNGWEKSFALWSVGITEQKEYTYLGSELQNLNEMTGKNALPHGILGEHSRCRVWENSQDDTWLDTYERGKPDLLFVWTNLYTRTLLAHCQDAEHVSSVNPEECCVTGPAGLICFYVSGTPGNDVREGGVYTKAPHVNGNAYIERAQPCEIGFCTNGRAYKDEPSPPPPPPYTMPPNPTQPGMPAMPPGQDRPEYPIDPPEPALPPGAHSPPPSPPPAAPAPPEVVVKRGSCSPIDSPQISDAQLSSFRAACDDGAYQLLESFSVEECTFDVGTYP